MAQVSPAPREPGKLTKEPPEPAAVKLARQLLDTEYQARTTAGRAWQSLRTAFRALMDRLRPRRNRNGGGGGGGYEGEWPQQQEPFQGKSGNQGLGRPPTYQEQDPRGQQHFQQGGLAQSQGQLNPNSPLGRLESAIAALDKPQREAFEDALYQLVSQDNKWSKALDKDLLSLPVVAHYASRGQEREVLRQAAADEKRAAERKAEPAPQLGPLASPGALPDANQMFAIAAEQEKAGREAAERYARQTIANDRQQYESLRERFERPAQQPSGQPEMRQVNAAPVTLHQWGDLYDAVALQSLKDTADRARNATPTTPVPAASSSTATTPTSPSTASVSAAAAITPTSPVSAPVSPVTPSATPATPVSPITPAATPAQPANAQGNGVLSAETVIMLRAYWNQSATNSSRPSSSSGNDGTPATPAVAARPAASQQQARGR